MSRRSLRTLASVVVLACALSACTPATSPDDDAASVSAADSRPVVVTTFSVLADLVRQIGGDRVRVESITKPGAEIHGYEPTPSDLKRIADADLLLNNGLGLETWFERFVRAIDAPRVVLSEGIEPIPITVGGYAGQSNPHAWIAPSQAKVYVKNALAALSELSPEDATYFAENAQKLDAELDEILDTARDRLEGGTTAALVTCEGAFSYLARDLGIGEHYLWPVNSESEGSPRQIREQISFVREHQIPTVFCESTVPFGPQERVAAETGASWGGVLYVDSLSAADGPVPDYLSLVRYTVDQIAKGLHAS
ncbi:manganese transport system substrate-binding protein [Neomicrococcus aestuarii]|uniref:Manganese transport system substrate-binding protein n=1 Tax=Neomicrococcus aestuarii TaxID=556325 RepID=A0A7W8TXB2_9MICC|nr:zinc ABC transporter substrate-binding protein [Neomicrococcus aestuarii]MBB5513880.1 manganese transport system substrate-binding protein [Neomicrococcus aestuarii]